MSLSFIRRYIYVYDSFVDIVVVYYARDTPGTQLIVYPAAFKEQWNTFWSYNASTMELYVVTNTGKKLNLTTTSDISVNGNSPLDQRKVWIDEPNETKNQQWLMDLSTNTIINRWNKMYLSVLEQNYFNRSGLAVSSFLVSDYNSGSGGFTRFNW
jgi:hypothetical protein